MKLRQEGGPIGGVYLETECKTRWCLTVFIPFPPLRETGRVWRSFNPKFCSWPEHGEIWRKLDGIPTRSMPSRVKLDCETSPRFILILAELAEFISHKPQ
jgi:hypothetical protein